jgi:hypothetical protein
LRSKSPPKIRSFNLQQNAGRIVGNDATHKKTAIDPFRSSLGLSNGFKQTMSTVAGTAMKNKDQSPINEEFRQSNGLTNSLFKSYGDYS